MKRFDSAKLAVLTGGGTGMGRELARQLSKEGCHVAICDVSLENMEQTRALCLESAPDGTRVSIFEADVSSLEQMFAFRDAVARAHNASCIHLLFNNAGIAGGSSFVQGDPVDWEKTFAVCWGGVYNGCRAFLPLLLASPEGHVVNTSSVNGFWASLGPRSANTAYSAAKFAVKGFSEALLGDFRNNAPHLKVSLVMPGHIGTSIVSNTARVLGQPEPKDLPPEEVERVRKQMAELGADMTGMSDDDVRRALQQRMDDFRTKAPLSAADAASQILDGVRKGRWRILVGDDARVLDELVRADPENAYEDSFMELLRARTPWDLGV